MGAAAKKIFCGQMRASLALAALLAILACGATAHARDLRSKQGGVQQLTESLREDITNPKVKKSFVGKFNKVKDERKKNASRNSLHGKKNKLADELTSSGHKAGPP